MKKNVKQIGEIGIDTALCWIGDPSYILHADTPPKAIGKDWSAFCAILQQDRQYPTAKQFNYDLGHPGLGVVVSTGYGDGVYPVYAAFGHEGRIAKVWVEFMDDDEATIPPTPAAERMTMPDTELLGFVARIARMTQDGEEIEGKKFVMENDAAVETLNELIDSARHLIVQAEGRPT